MHYPNILPTTFSLWDMTEIPHCCLPVPTFVSWCCCHFRHQLLVRSFALHNDVFQHSNFFIQMGDLTVVVLNLIIMSINSFLFLADLMVVVLQLVFQHIETVLVVVGILFKQHRTEQSVNTFSRMKEIEAMLEVQICLLHINLYMVVYDRHPFQQGRRQHIVTSLPRWDHRDQSIIVVMKFLVADPEGHVVVDGIRSHVDSMLMFTWVATTRITREVTNG
jgi:hypothetical protein